MYMTQNELEINWLKVSWKNLVNWIHEECDAGLEYMEIVMGAFSKFNWVSI